MFHVQVDAVGNDEHQDGRPEQRQRGAHRIAPQFQRLAQCIAEGPTQVESEAMQLGRYCGAWRGRLWNTIRFGSGRLG